MKLTDYPVYPTSEVSFYADRVIRELGLRDPPVPYDPILEYFGLELHWIDHQSELEFERQKGYKVEIPALLCRRTDKPVILVREMDRRTRQRLSVFHECGHFDIPWHGENDYLCECGVNNVQVLKSLEKQAYEYASNLIFPRRLFFGDAADLRESLETIEILASRYDASIEATAIHYVKNHPGICAIVYISRNTDSDAGNYPFVVDYSVVSKRFHGFWKKGHKLPYNEEFEKSLAGGEIRRSTFPASIFGSSKVTEFFAELKRYGLDRDRISVFLSIPDPQARFF